MINHGKGSAHFGPILAANGELGKFSDTLREFRQQGPYLERLHHVYLWYWYYIRLAPYGAAHASVWASSELRNMQQGTCALPAPPPTTSRGSCGWSCVLVEGDTLTLSHPVHWRRQAPEKKRRQIVVC